MVRAGGMECSSAVFVMDTSGGIAGDTGIQDNGFPNERLVIDAAGIFQALDAFGLTMIEQPLAADDLAAHAVLQFRVSTPVCLDESLDSQAAARSAIALGSCRVIDIKPGRVGGPTAAIGVHHLARQAGIPVWIGGMFESGIGRAFNIALAALSGFSLPADMSPASFYFDGDLAEDGFQSSPRGTTAVPSRNGPGFTVDEARIEVWAKGRHHPQRLGGRMLGLCWEP